MQLTGVDDDEGEDDDDAEDWAGYAVRSVLLYFFRSEGGALFLYSDQKFHISSFLCLCLRVSFVSLYLSYLVRIAGLGGKAH